MILLHCKGEMKEDLHIWIFSNIKIIHWSSVRYCTVLVPNNGLLKCKKKCKCLMLVMQQNFLFDILTFHCTNVAFCLCVYVLIKLTKEIENKKLFFLLSSSHSLLQPCFQKSLDAVRQKQNTMICKCFLTNI